MSIPTEPTGEAPRPDQDLAPAAGADDGGAAVPPPRPPGGSIFTIEGRAAPGLYLVGWLASVAGLGILLVGLLASGGAAPVVLSAAGAALLGLGLVAAAGSQAIERQARAEAAYVGPSPFLVFAASLPLTILLVIVVVGPASLLGFDLRSPAASLVSVLATALVYAGLVRLLVVGPGGLGWREMGFGPLGPGAVRDLALGALLALPVIVVTSALASLLVQLVGAAPDSPLPPSGGGPGLLVNLVSAMVVAPVGEELFYRGFATTAWARSIGARRALVRGAIFFALVHVLTISGATFGETTARAFVAFVARLPVAFALGWVFLERRSIYVSIGLHATFNGLLVILAELAAGSSIA